MNEYVPRGGVQCSEVIVKKKERKSSCSLYSSVGKARNKGPSKNIAHQKVICSQGKEKGKAS